MSISATSRLPSWFWALCLTHAGSLLVFLNFAGALPLIQADWGLTHTQAGIIQAAVQVGYLIAVLLLSSLTDFLAAEHLILWGAVGAGLGNLAFALLARGVVSATILRAVIGCGIAGIYMPGVKLISQAMPAAQRGRALGFFVASFTVGSSVSVALGGSLAASYGWRPVFALMSLGPLLGAVAAQYAGRRVPPRASGPRDDQDQERRPLMTELWRNRNAWLVIAAYTAHVWELFGLRGWLPAFLTAALEYTGIDLAEATRSGAHAAGLATLMGAVAIAAGATLSDRYGRTPVMLAVAAAGLVCTAGLGFTLTWPWAAVVTAALVAAFAVSADSAVLSTALTEAVPAAYLGRALAIYSFCGFAAGSASPMVFGALLDHAGAGWSSAFMSLALGGLIALLAAIILHQRLRPLSVGVPGR